MFHQNISLVREIFFITHYKFKNESLLSEVLTPPYLYKNASSPTTPYCFERLEFLGDSILNMVVSVILFKLYPSAKEGDMTLRKNALVSGRKLTEIARSLRIMRLIPECPGKIFRRDCDTLEALIGAIYIDGGIKNAKQFIERHWKKAAREMIVAPIDPKSQLYMWAQKRHLPIPVYKVLNRTFLEQNYTLTLQLKETHGLGIVKLTTDTKKKGEVPAAEAMLKRIDNRKNWKTLFKSNGDFITEDDLLYTAEDIKRRLFLWCKAHNAPLPQYKTVAGVVQDRNETIFTSLVYFSDHRGAYGVSHNGRIAEKKAAFKMLLRLCDEEREKYIFGGQKKFYEIDMCVPKNFKSLLDEWVMQNHLGSITYSSQELEPGLLYNVSLVIPNAGLGTVFSQSNRRRTAEHRAAALMIERIVTQYNSSDSHSPVNKSGDLTNRKVQLHMWTTKHKLPNPRYVVEDVSGLPHGLNFTVSVSVNGFNKTFASAFSKKIAQQKAAFLMIQQIDLVKPFLKSRLPHSR